MRLRAERDRLREVNAELVKALEIVLPFIAPPGFDHVRSLVSAALAKADKARGKA